MKTYERELELGFEVSAAKAVKTTIRENLSIIWRNVIYQMWLEEGKVGDYKFRTRIRKTEVSYPDAIGSQAGKYEFTTKYSKNDEKAAEQDNMELNAEITFEEYEKLKQIYQAAGKEEVVKVRTFLRDILREPLNASAIYTLDTYPNEEGDRARIEIEFPCKEEMERWKAPAWLKKLIGNKDKGKAEK